MIKLCGMRRHEDIGFANEFLPDFVGFILAEGFRRSVTAEYAAEISAPLDSRIKKVGVFVDQSPEEIARAVRIVGLDSVQLHGRENSETVSALRRLLPHTPLWKAVRVRESSDIINAQSLGCDVLLLDSFSEKSVGGTGKTADLEVIRSTDFSAPFFLAGGIGKDNLSSALKFVSGFKNGLGVDLSSSVETDGFKDRGKIAEVMEIYNENMTL
ncbi:MAG: phosphoribosylanthranilate isomerase [Huintestinicola sp.]